MDETTETIEKLCIDVLSLMPMLTRTEPSPPRPVFIEFAGTPKAGKSFMTERTEAILRHNGIRARLIPEAGAACPIRKKDDVDFNLWTSSQTLLRVIAELDRNDAQVIILDRGIFDPLIWFNWMQMTGRLSPQDFQVISRYLTMDRWCDVIDLVFIMTVEPDVALERDHHRLTGHKGRIMNKETLTQLNRAIHQTREQFGKNFSRVLHFDTTLTQSEVGLESCIKLTLTTLREFLSETLIVIDRKDIADMITPDMLVTDPKTLASLRNIITSRHRAVPRTVAEKDPDLVQIIPCAVLVSNGRILLLKRREAESSHRLHDRFAIWAGGHARDRDAEGSADLVYRALERELSEELDIRTGYEAKELGIIIETSDPRSQRHLCVCFLAELQSEDVAIARDGREFRESKGRSLSGKFVKPDKICDVWNEVEPWSQIILRDHFKVSPIKREIDF